MMNKTTIKSMTNSFLLVATMAALSACADNLPDELFEKKTYLVENGWKDFELEVDENNVALLPVYFGVSGTSGNDKNITLTLAVDTDTLDKYNWEKYKNQTDLYYKLLPEETYTLDADSWTIPEGELKTTANISISLDKIAEVGSLYDDYVLPLKIATSVGEPANKSKYSTVLAHIGFKNDLSGDYGGSGTIQQQGTEYTSSVNNVKVYAINQNTCYLFVGDKKRENTNDYKDYIFNLIREEDGSFSLSSSVESLEFVPKSVSIKRKYTLTYGDDRYYYEITTLELSYEYTDSSLYSEPVRMEFQGTYTMTKSVWKYEYPDVDVEE